MNKKHHPPHLYLDDTVYFLTARVYGKQHILNTDTKKQLLLDIINKVFLKYQFKMYAWVILNNHYHIEFKTRLGSDLVKVMQFIHGRCSFKINNLENCRGRKIFQNYWDHGIRNEHDFYVHFNYIHNNPVKHGYVNEMGEYPFSSYQYWYEKKSEEWIQSCFLDHPVVDFTVTQDGDF